MQELQDAVGRVEAIVSRGIDEVKAEVRRSEEGWRARTNELSTAIQAHAIELAVQARAIQNAERQRDRDVQEREHSENRLLTKIGLWVAGISFIISTLMSIWLSKGQP